MTYSNKALDKKLKNYWQDLPPYEKRNLLRYLGIISCLLLLIPFSLAEKANICWGNRYIINNRSFFTCFNPFNDNDFTFCERGKWCKNISIPYQVQWSIMYKNCVYDEREFPEMKQYLHGWFLECTNGLDSYKDFLKLKGVAVELPLPSATQG